MGKNCKEKYKYKLKMKEFQGKVFYIVKCQPIKNYRMSDF